MVIGRERHVRRCRAGGAFCGLFLINAGDCVRIQGVIEETLVVNKADGKKKKNGSRVLRAADIVPSSEAGEGADSGARVSSEIPKFDLGEQILAEQRKVTSTRRKGPGKKGNGGAEGQHGACTSGTVEKSEQDLCDEEQVIAEIVARDIEQLYASNGQGP